MKNIIRAVLPFAALVALPLGMGSATAAAATPTTVTIQAAGTDLYGTVSSPKAACEADRKVVVYKQKGTRGGGDDVRIASDTTYVTNGVGEWSTGNTGMTGKFYAKATKTAACKADASPTIRATTT